jgi:hypothetical protein
LRQRTDPASAIRVGEQFLDKVQKCGGAYRLQKICGIVTVSHGREHMISESGEDDCWNAERVGHHDELKAVVLLQANIGDQQVRRQRAQKRDGLLEAAASGAFEAGSARNSARPFRVVRSSSTTSTRFTVSFSFASSSHRRPGMTHGFDRRCGNVLTSLVL